MAKVTGKSNTNSKKVAAPKVGKKKGTKRDLELTARDAINAEGAAGTQADVSGMTPTTATPYAGANTAMPKDPPTANTVKKLVSDPGTPITKRGNTIADDVIRSVLGEEASKIIDEIKYQRDDDKWPLRAIISYDMMIKMLNFVNGIATRPADPDAINHPILTTKGRFETVETYQEGTATESGGSSDDDDVYIPDYKHATVGMYNAATGEIETEELTDHLMFALVHQMSEDFATGVLRDQHGAATPKMEFETPAEGQSMTYDMQRRNDSRFTMEFLVLMNNILRAIGQLNAEIPQIDAIYRMVNNMHEMRGTATASTEPAEPTVTNENGEGREAAVKKYTYVCENIGVEGVTMKDFLTYIGVTDVVCADPNMKEVFLNSVVGSEDGGDEETEDTEEIEPPESVISLESARKRLKHICADLNSEGEVSISDVRHAASEASAILVEACEVLSDLPGMAAELSMAITENGGERGTNYPRILQDAAKIVADYFALVKAGKVSPLQRIEEEELEERSAIARHEIDREPLYKEAQKFRDKLIQGVVDPNSIPDEDLEQYPPSAAYPGGVVPPVPAPTAHGGHTVYFNNCNIGMVGGPKASFHCPKVGKSKNYSGKHNEKVKEERTNMSLDDMAEVLYGMLEFEIDGKTISEHLAAGVGQRAILEYLKAVHYADEDEDDETEFGDIVTPIIPKSKRDMPVSYGDDDEEDEE